MISTTWTPGVGTQNRSVFGASPSWSIGDLDKGTPLGTTAAAHVNFNWSNTAWPSPPVAPFTLQACDSLPFGHTIGIAEACGADQQVELPPLDQRFRDAETAAAGPAAETSGGDAVAGDGVDYGREQDHTETPHRARVERGGMMGDEEQGHATQDAQPDPEEEGVPQCTGQEQDLPDSKINISSQTNWPAEAYARKAFLPPSTMHEYKIQGTERRYGNLGQRTLAYRMGPGPCKTTRKRGVFDLLFLNPYSLFMCANQL